jgi:hypothetical protein
MNYRIERMEKIMSYSKPVLLAKSTGTQLESDNSKKEALDALVVGANGAGIEAKGSLCR